ncbi:hypothetical protein C2S52_017961 [Perilla frutescens var. hirtella]|uniref:Uncharacterized protein n=1 Tax=Perilla frutescens var. hirtella TaxID=608512 RepID=A0AAD4P541_PERFH|nr:hypothetical protein C2S52_017961 [Perilla frutescens var. hirtella]KAH6827169.1 hypothetical protein C2S53_019232 [Perilla frutescens var. hirtella]
MAPSSSPSPSKKLLIADSKPKSGPDSASSSSATSTPPAPPEKRTRDQPNLSDCHCCDRRIIHSNPKDRLQPLDSVWRIVLLCRKCRRSVCSGQTCPYCFQATGNSGDLCTCRVCHRKIHKDCVRDYGKCTPWCYLGGGFEGFRVCVDCWVPELLKKNSVQVLGRSENRDGLKDKGEGKDLLENGKCEGGKKVKKVAKAKEQASRRAKGVIDEVDLVDGESDLFAKNDRDSLKAVNSSCSSETEVVDDAELAIQLHRVINSSPRILRGKSLGNSNDSDAPSSRNWKGLSYKRSGLGKRCIEDRKLEVFTNSAENGRVNQTVQNDSSIGFGGFSQGIIPYERDRKRKIWQLENDNAEISKSTSSQQAALKNLYSDEAGVRCSLKNGADTLEDSIGANVGRSNSCIDGGRFGQELMRYKRTRLKNKACQLNGLVGVSGGSSSCGNHGLAFKSEYCLSDYANLHTGSLVMSGTKESGSSDTERDRYLLKYVKRIPGTKTDSSFVRYGTFLSENQVSAPVASYSEVTFPVNDCELILPNGTCAHSADRYLFKYAKRVKSSKSGSNSEAKLHSNVFLDKIDISATGLTANCSAESRTVSDVSFDSFTVDLPQ